MEYFRITVEGKTYDVVVEKTGSDETNTPAPTASAPAAPAATPAAQPAAPPAPVQAASGEDVSPLAGVVQSIHVTVGSTVKTGDKIITLEAMKMFTAINASSNGIIRAIHVKIGDAVDEGQPLYLIG